MIIIIIIISVFRRPTWHFNTAVRPWRKPWNWLQAGWGVPYPVPSFFFFIIPRSRQADKLPGWIPCCGRHVDLYPLDQTAVCLNRLLRGANAWGGRIFDTRTHTHTLKTLSFLLWQLFCLCVFGVKRYVSTNCCLMRCYHRLPQYLLFYLSLDLEHFPSPSAVSFRPGLWLWSQWIYVRVRLQCNQALSRPSIITFFSGRSRIQETDTGVVSPRSTQL